MTRETRLIFNVAGMVGDGVPDFGVHDKPDDHWFAMNYKKQRVQWMRS